MKLIRLALCFSVLFSYVIAENISSKNLHLLNRITFGPNSTDLEQIHRMGYFAYLEQQLNPDEISLPLPLKAKLDHFPLKNLSTRELYLKGNKEPVEAQKIFLEFAEMRLLQSIESPRQLYEVMVDFWFNHFNVSATKGLDRLWVGAFERDAIRPHALGKFSDLLLATAQHPAMLFYLDNWQNKAPKKKEGINENYAREVMELHTLGVDGGYTQADVIALAHILTGWGFILQDTPKHPAATFFFDPNAHDPSTQRVMGRDFGGQGIEGGVKALEFLANHPSTAKHIAFKLAQYFVEDNPPKDLVNQLAEKFRSTGGDIKSVLRMLFQSNYFMLPSNYNKKFKTPYRYIVSAVRLSDVTIKNFRPLINQLRQLEMPIYSFETPDGYKNTKDEWLTPNALLNRITFANALSNGQLPLNAVPDSVGFQKIPVDPVAIEKISQKVFSEQILKLIQNAPAQDRPALILANPEMMRH